MELVKFEGMPVVPVTEEELQKVLSSDYLPRLQVVDSNSKVCKKKLAEAGNYALIRSEDDVVDLTNQIDVLLVHMRWTALDVNGETPVSSHDRESEEFQRIEEESSMPNSGCMWGPEFLLWIPSAKTFATFFCSSATSRREAKNIFKLLRQPATLKTHFIETKKYSWYGPLVTSCSTPFDIPPMEEIKTQAMKFANPPSRDTGEAGEAPKSTRER